MGSLTSSSVTLLTFDTLDLTGCAKAGFMFTVLFSKAARSRALGPFQHSAPHCDGDVRQEDDCLLRLYSSVFAGQEKTRDDATVGISGVHGSKSEKLVFIKMSESVH